MMKKFRLNIDGKEVFGLPGQTILDVAKENDIFIPTLCYDERTEIYGSCGLCMVEMEGNPKLWKACATEIADGMVIRTDTERVLESRKSNLELLVSNHTGDCRPPCTLACPANTDCQGYVGLIANGEFEKANELIKETNPLPGCIGRVCPHPCEEACRRGLIEAPISIMHMKRIAHDHDMMLEEPFIPEVGDPTGKSVAIIGGGPLGLSAAYFLRIKGHDVAIFDTMPKMGGMLRYGIPEYRLPKEVLDEEIALIEEMGVEMVNNTKVGEDIPFETIRSDFDAVLLGIGAWISTGVGCPGEDANGVIGGIDFLKRVVRNESINLGEKVAIVGGGNTAMDACRTAVRLGAREVYNIYRRTKDEMPADLLEIEEAEEEGVIFKNLTNPKEIIKDENGNVKEMVLQCMELGEPDSSGRRRPMAIEGKTENIELDSVILAIGQAVDSDIFNVEKTKKNGIAYDPQTFMTSEPGIFAGGDCGNDKISIAIEAIADARKAADAIDSYLNGEVFKYQRPFYVLRGDIDEKTFEDRERLCRQKPDQLSPEERKDNFSEIIFGGLTDEQAIKEGHRCLECGCHDYFECKLVEYANQYGVRYDRFMGEKKRTQVEDDHPFIVRDPDKCILCGLCVRACDEVMGVGCLGLVDRGFDTVVLPNMGKTLLEAGCESCGQCVSVCPVGAIQEIQTVQKEVPVDFQVAETTCSYCSVGCSLELDYYGDMLIKADPSKDGYVNHGICCGKGKWGFDTAVLEDKIVDPMIKVGKELIPTDYHEAVIMMAKKLQSVKSRHGASSIAVAISDRYTNEEAYVMKKFADVVGAKPFTFNKRVSGVNKILGLDREASPNTIDEILSTDLIIVPAFIKSRNPVIWNKIKQAAAAGVKVITLNTKNANSKWDFKGDVTNIKIHDDIWFLKKMAKHLISMGKTHDAKGFDEFKKSLKDIEADKNSIMVAEAYANAKKAMFVFQQNVISVEGAELIAELAILSGHIGSPRDGILEIKPKNNSQGLVDLGIKMGSEAMEGVKGLIIFGEDPVDYDFSNLEFLGVSDTHMTDTAKKADVVIPGTGFACASGTFTNTERRLLPVEPAIDEDVDLYNWEIAAELAHVFEVDFDFEDEYTISKEMNNENPIYRYAVEGEISGGVLAPLKPEFIPAGKGKLVDELISTDALMRVTASRIPDVTDPLA